MPRESGPTNRDRDYLFDIVDAMRHVVTYAHGMTRDQFESDERTQDAVVRRVTLVGEAAKRLSPEFREAHSAIPWKEMAGMRDIVVHDYDGIDWGMVWSLVEMEIPRLLPKLNAILAELA